MRQSTMFDPNKSRDINTVDDNRDPVSGEPGAHPVGTGMGAVGGGVVGGTIGAPAGPIGAAVGAAAGAVAGGLMGKAVAEELDPTAEERHWGGIYTSRPYYEDGFTYVDYAPAYRYGWEAAGRHGGRKFDELERSLETEWDGAKRSSKLGWEKAKHAVRDAYERVARKFRRDEE